MAYDPERHHRRSIRLRGYDYRQAGVYFVTICTHNRRYLFGKVKDGQMHLNAYGRIVLSKWRALPRHFQNLRLGAFVVMPNHVHGILIINERGHGVIGDGVLGGRGVVGGDGVMDGDGVVGGRGRGKASAGTLPSEQARTILPDSTDETGLLDALPLPAGTDAGSLAAIVQNFKSTVTRSVNRRRGIRLATQLLRTDHPHRT